MKTAQTPDSKLWEVLNLVLPSDREKFNSNYIDYLTRRSNKRVNRLFAEEEEKKREHSEE